MIDTLIRIAVTEPKFAAVLDREIGIKNFKAKLPAEYSLVALTDPKFAVVLAREAANA